ncbi:MAG: hypothetical protein V7629_18440 [Motiliproteus sp.]
MDQTKAINRYRNLLVVSVLLLGALGLALYESKVEQYHQQQSLNSVPEQPSVKPTEALFSIGTDRYSLEMLGNDFQSPLYQIRKMSYEQQSLVLQEAVIEIYIANKLALSDNKAQVMTELFPELSVSDDEVADYYQQNQNTQTPPLDALRAQLAEYLLALKRESAKKQLLNRLLASGEAQLLLEAPKEPTDTQ